MAASRRATISAVAERAGVSRTTVSLVLADHPRITEATKARVRQAMDEVGYIYNRAASMVRGSRSSLLGLIVTDIRNPFFSELTMGVDKAVGDHDLSVMLGFSRGSSEQQSRIARSLIEHMVLGLMVLPTPGTEAAELSRPGTPPVIVLLREVDGLDSDFVGVDNRLSGRLLGTHLRDQGYDQAWLVGGEQHSAQFDDRLAGVAAGLGGQVRAVHGGGRALGEAISASGAPQAVITYNDTYLLETSHALRVHGLAPGEQVGLASFDNTSMTSELDPGVTSIDHHAARIAESAVRLLLRRTDEPEGTVERVLIQPELVVRPSTTARR